MIMKDRETGVSRENSFHRVPVKFDTHWTHFAEGALNDKGFLTAAIDASKLPLDLVSITQIIVGVNGIFWLFKMTRHAAKVKELQLLPHLLDLPMIQHF